MHDFLPPRFFQDAGCVHASNSMSGRPCTSINTVITSRDQQCKSCTTQVFLSSGKLRLSDTENFSCDSEISIRLSKQLLTDSVTVTQVLHVGLYTDYPVFMRWDAVAFWTLAIAYALASSAVFLSQCIKKKTIR